MPAWSGWSWCCCGGEPNDCACTFFDFFSPPDWPFYTDTNTGPGSPAPVFEIDSVNHYLKARRVGTGSAQGTRTTSAALPTFAVGDAINVSAIVMGPRHHQEVEYYITEHGVVFGDSTDFVRLTVQQFKQADDGFESIGMRLSYGNVLKWVWFESTDTNDLSTDAFFKAGKIKLRLVNTGTGTFNIECYGRGIDPSNPWQIVHTELNVALTLPDPLPAGVYVRSMLTQETVGGPITYHVGWDDLCITITENDCPVPDPCEWCNEEVPPAWQVDTGDPPEGVELEEWWVPAADCNTEDLWFGVHTLNPISNNANDDCCWERCGEVAHCLYQIPPTLNFACIPGDVTISICTQLNADDVFNPFWELVLIYWWSGAGVISPGGCGSRVELAVYTAPIEQVCGPATFTKIEDNTGVGQFFPEEVIATRVGLKTDCEHVVDTACCEGTDLPNTIPVRRAGLFPATSALVYRPFQDGGGGFWPSWSGFVADEVCTTFVEIVCKPCGDADVSCQDEVDTNHPSGNIWHIRINGCGWKYLTGVTCVPFSAVVSLHSLGVHGDFHLGCTWLVIGDDDGTITDVDSLDVTFTFNPDDGGIADYVQTRTLARTGCNTFADSYTASSPCGDKEIEITFTLDDENDATITVVVDGVNFFTGTQPYSCDPFSASFPGPGVATFCGVPGTVSASVSETP